MEKESNVASAGSKRMPQVSPFLPLNIFVTISNIFRWIKENVPDWAQAVVASPDEGGTRRAGQFCRMCGNWYSEV